MKYDLIIESLPGEVLLPLVVAAGIGLVLGLERELSHKPAGLRTQVLVTLGATLFVLTGRSLGGDGVGKLAANVVTGLGFLGAGVIFREGGTVRGLTTAALVWVNGALGVAVGLHDYPLAVGGTLAVLLGLRLLGGVERALATKCRVAEYRVTATESEELVQAVHDAITHGHFQERPLSFTRQDGQILMRFGFCNAPREHDQLAERIRKMPGVVKLQVR